MISAPAAPRLWKPPSKIRRGFGPHAVLGQLGGRAEDLRTRGPLIQVNVGTPKAQGGSGRAPITALIDTGASITAIDAQAAAKLGLAQTGSIQVGGVGGLSRQPVFAAAIEVQGVGRVYDPIQLAGATLTGTQFQMLLGRNILKEMVLSYDGPAGAFNLSLASGQQPGTVQLEPSGPLATGPTPGAPPIPGAAPIPGPLSPEGIPWEGIGYGAAALAAGGALFYFMGLFD